MSILSFMRTGAVLSAILFMAVTLTMAQEGKPTLKKVPVTPTAADSGQEMYHAYCAACHGSDGKGGGPAAVALKGPIPDLTTLAKRHGGKYPDTYVQNVLRFGAENLSAHGSKDMPIWGPVLASVSGNSGGLTTLRIHNLTQYLETLQAK